jgi:hypothetical protein
VATAKALQKYVHARELEQSHYDCLKSGQQVADLPFSSAW